MAKQSFEKWLEKMNLALVKLCGMDYRDLPDCPYMDWYEDGVSPSAAARRAFKGLTD